MPTVLIAISWEQNAVVLRTGEGREFIAKNAVELWGDALNLLKTESTAIAIPRESDQNRSRDPRAHRVTAEVIDPPPMSDKEAKEEALIQGMHQAADVAEEMAAQEWGALGRMFAQGVRSGAPTVARQLQSTLGTRRRSRRRAKK